MFAFKEPASDVIATNQEFNLRLYAELANDPFYATVRLIAPDGIDGGRKRSFWLTWTVDTQRLLRRGDTGKLPEDILIWVQDQLCREFPVNATAACMDADEFARLTQERAEKRAMQRKK